MHFLVLSGIKVIYDVKKNLKSPKFQQVIIILNKKAKIFLIT